jgi:peptide-methionine (S)-S-oxide reductase
MQAAKTAITKREQSGCDDKRIVTTLEALAEFYPAESYHQGYALANPNQPYCQFLVLPKLAKFRQQFASLLK